MHRLIRNGIIALTAALLVIAGCQKEKPRIRVKSELPDQQFINSRTIITENGVTTAIVESKRVDVYEERNYSVIQDSIRIEIFSKNGKRVSTLTAKNGEVWGLYEKVDSLKATGDVVILSEERNAKMETPAILWVASIHKVFADTVRLSTEDAVEEGVKFEATDDLKSYTMKNVSGEVQGRNVAIPER